MHLKNRLIIKLITEMRIQCVFILLIITLNSFGQNIDSIPIEFFKNGKKIDLNFDIELLNKDTSIRKSIQKLSKYDINKYSIRICSDKYRLLVPIRYDSINFFRVYVNKKSYRKLKEAKFGMGKLFKKYYYVNLGLNVMLRVSRSKKKYCK